MDPLTHEEVSLKKGITSYYVLGHRRINIKTMQPTLYQHLKEEAPDFSSLSQKYSSLLELVNVLIGVIPNCDPVMEIWPTSFRTYNLLVPNLLNLPGNLFRKRSIKKMMGLAMYQSSSASGCNYCTAHCCSFALRRGVDESVILGNLNDKETAVVTFSRKMGAIPCTVTTNDLENLQMHCSREEVEAVSMGIILMGFLNKYMDVMGIELEQGAIDDVYDVLKDTKWKIGKHVSPEPQITTNSKSVEKDNLMTYLKVIRQAPGAIRLEKQWLKDVPKTKDKINDFLKMHVGHDFPFLKKITRVKLKRAIAAVLRDNFSGTNTKIGLKTKIISALMFFQEINNSYLQKEILTLAKNNKMEVDDKAVEMIRFFPEGTLTAFLSDSSFSFLSKKEKLAIYFTAKASGSPAEIEQPLLLALTDQYSAAEIVELVTWLSVLQALHRLERLPTQNNN